MRLTVGKEFPVSQRHSPTPDAGGAARSRFASTRTTKLMPALLAAALLWPGHVTLADFKETVRLVDPGDGIGLPNIGGSVALSGAGNTAVLGGPADNSSVGAVWVFIRVLGDGFPFWIEQSKLVGSQAQAGDAARQGRSVAISADGNTVIWGGHVENNLTGAAWVWTRNGINWTEQAKLVASDAVGPASQGHGVALSADGNTAIVGAPGDSNGVGAAWVWTRSGGVWTKQVKLVPGTAIGQAHFGDNVALSADGTIALVAGPGDSLDSSGVATGAAWAFSNRNGFWIEEAKLVDTSTSFQGSSVAVSGDSTTALSGAVGDNGGVGAAVVWIRSPAGAWTKQAKLIGSGAIGKSEQGGSVALSGGGNTAIVGGVCDNVSDLTFPCHNPIGAAWVFTRSGGVWSQQGNKLVGTGSTSPPAQGLVALSCNTALLGGASDNNASGSVWVFSAPATSTHDFGGKSGGFFPTAADCMSDILWYNFNTGQVVNWLLNGATVIGGGSPGQTDPAMWAIVGQRDFNGDGTNDILWRNSTSGDVVLWALNGPNVLPFPASRFLGTKTTDFAVVGTGDFDGNGFGDILWFNTATRAVSIWFMDETLVPTEAQLSMQPPPPWTIAGTGDFNGDGMTDIIWSATSNGQVQVLLWFMNGATQIGGGPPVPPGSSTPLIPPTPWTIAGTGDFNGDGFSDILWHNPSGGQVLLWLMNGTTVNPASGSPVLRTRNAGSSTAPAISTATVSATSCGCNPLRFRAGVTNLRSCSGSLAARR